MQNDSSVTPDFLVAVWATIKSVCWVIFGTPLILWDKNAIYCRNIGPCTSTAGPFSIFACFLLVWIIWRSLAYGWGSFGRVAVLAVMIGLYLSLPAIYDGLSVMEQRRIDEERTRRIEEQKRPRAYKQEQPSRFPDVFSR